MALEKKEGKDLGTPIGIMIGVSVILIAIGIASVEGISQSDKFGWFFGIQNADALFIVLGSTLAAAMVAIPLN